MKPIDTKTWQEFKIEDLFDSQTGDTDLKKPHLNGKGHAVITSGLNNMGVFGYSDEPAKIIKKNTITVDMFGYAIFRPFDYKMVTHARVFSLEPKGFELNEMTGLYMSTIFKHLSTLFNYNNMCSYNKIKHLTVKLPVQQTLDPDKTYHPDGYIPDWNYMEAFMEQINQQAQARLDEYKGGKLEYTTLDSKIGYTPVDTESWAEFKVGDLFEKLDLKCKKTDFQKNNDLSKIKTDEFNLPLVNAKQGNNGIMYYGREEDWEYAEMTIDIVSDGAVSAGNVYPQPHKTGILYNAYLIKPLKKDVTENHLSFLATVIEKYVKQKYSYENKCIWKKLSLDKIQLPIDSTGQPDWNYMEAFMKQINQQAKVKLSTLEKGKA